MTGQGQPRPARMSAYATASSHLALLSDLALKRMVDQAPQVRPGIGGTSATVEAEGVRVFVEQVPVTERELRPGNVRSTANLFGLPGFDEYGLGSAGFGAWRELAAHIMTTNWVLSDEHRAFALLYHWRLLPGPASTEAVFAEFGDLDGAVAHWEGSAAVRTACRPCATRPHVCCCSLQHIPQTLASWTADQDLSAFSRVDTQLADAPRSCASGSTGGLPTAHLLASILEIDGHRLSLRLRPRAPRPVAADLSWTMSFSSWSSTAATDRYYNIRASPGQPSRGRARARRTGPPPVRARLGRRRPAPRRPRQRGREPDQIRRHHRRPQRLPSKPHGTQQADALPPGRTRADPRSRRATPGLHH